MQICCVSYIFGLWKSKYEVGNAAPECIARFQCGSCFLILCFLCSIFSTMIIVLSIRLRLVITRYLSTFLGIQCNFIVLSNFIAMMFTLIWVFLCAYDSYVINEMFLIFLRLIRLLKRTGQNRDMVMVFNTFQQYFSYIVAVSFIGRVNRSTRRKPPTSRKSLTYFISKSCIEYAPPERDSNSQRQL